MMIEVIAYSDVVEINYDASTLFIDIPFVDEISEFIESNLPPIEDILKGIDDMKEAILLDKGYCFDLCHYSLRRLSDDEFVCCFGDRYSVSIGNWLNNYTLWSHIGVVIANKQYGTCFIDGDKVVRE